MAERKSIKFSELDTEARKELTKFKKMKLMSAKSFRLRRRK